MHHIWTNSFIFMYIYITDPSRQLPLYNCKNIAMDYSAEDINSHN